MSVMRCYRRTSHIIARVSGSRSRGGRPTERRQDKRRCWPLAKPLSAHAFQACRRAVGVPCERELTSIRTSCAAPGRLLARTNGR